MTIEILKQMPGHLVRRVQQISSAIFNEEMADYELTSVQFMALVAIADMPMLDATRLAELIDFDRATIGGVIERLERKGLINRGKNLNDKRIKTLSATPAGRALIRVCFDRVGQVQARLLKGLSNDEAQLFVQLLGHIVRLSSVSETDLSS